ncbi:neuraminidase-like domain-containing protein [Yersinia bercovieri]|uniref:Tc toxin subunit A-related protein n=1 Tax=Yersinia bercovieri TaxID=634 RepID=UPI0011AB7E2B|nr:neuraminidase-like domain-containing protein [Yersinia bercovieri]
MPNAIVLNKIKESRRDALVDYYLAKDSSADPSINTAEKLYQHLLLDTKVDHEVKTSPIAEAISSLQLYIERCIDGAESDTAADKVKKHFSTDNFLHNWNLYNKRYPRWAGNEKLKYYAADYIDPALRYNKTELFSEFEQNINQGKLNEQAVYSAIQKYLIKYNHLTHLQTISHLVVAENSTHFFIGRSQEIPYKYYWRSCKQTSDISPRYIWSEWKEINANIDGLEKKYITTSWNKHHLYLSWISKEKRKNNEGEEYIHTVHQTSYKNDDDTWVNNYKFEFDYDKSYPTSELQLLQFVEGSGEFYVRKIKNPDGTIADGKLNALLTTDKIADTVISCIVNIDQPFLPSGDENKNINIDNVILVTRDGHQYKLKNIISKKEIVLAKGIPEYIYTTSPLNSQSGTDLSNEIITDTPESLAAPDSLPLISKLQQGIDILLSYDTQSNSVGIKAFNQSYGLYLWELFFHIPLLASARFLTEQRFDESERWLKFLFSSAGYRDNNGELQLVGNNTRHWNTLPLQQDNDWDNSTKLSTNDPDIIAMQDPMQYKLAVFIRTLDALITRGDFSYRQLERDTLVDAKMYYVQASQLLGERPNIGLTDNWKVDNLQKVAATLTKENSQGDFLPPYNEVLLSYWDKIDIRLYNLRHNLSLDGQPLHLPLFAPPVDPTELQRQQVNADGISSSTAPKTANTSLYRFPLLLERAKGAVNSVIQFGNTLQIALEKQDNEALSLLLQQQQQRIQKQTLDIQKTNIEMLTCRRNTTEIAKGSAEKRLNYYSQLITSDISGYEQKALDMRITAQALGLTAAVPLTVGGALDTAPNIFGMADGGSHWGAISQSVAWGIQIASGGIEQGAGIQEIKGSYARRAGEWQLQKTLAEKDVAQLKEQLKELQLQISMASKQHNLTEMEQAHSLAVYQMQTHRFSGKMLYDWMVGRLTGLYYQLFDAAQPLCLMAKSALERDIDASKTQSLFVNSGWNNLYQGLLAGEELMLNLQKLENVWLMEEQRALEVERTVSLASHYQNLTDKSFPLADTIMSCVSGNKAEKFGTDQDYVNIHDDILFVSLNINNLQLAADYPETMHLGTIRRIKQISVSLPALLGPYQDVQATLSYGGEATSLANGCSALAVSRGMNDSGQFQLDFNDGKYLPFEGIDISDSGTLLLRFPNATKKQKALLQSLSDIILHIRYTIRF